MFPSHEGLRKYILYYNIVFPASDTFVANYMLMPNACGTLSLAFDGTSVIAELSKPLFYSEHIRHYYNKMGIVPCLCQ